jgi:hypothetical protein
VFHWCLHVRMNDRETMKVLDTPKILHFGLMTIGEFVGWASEQSATILIESDWTTFPARGP